MFEYCCEHLMGVKITWILSYGENIRNNSRFSSGVFNLTIKLVAVTIAMPRVGTAHARPDANENGLYKKPKKYVRTIRL